MSITTWFSIFSGSSERLIRSLRFDLMRTARRAKIPIDLALHSPSRDPVGRGPATVTRAPEMPPAPREIVSISLARRARRRPSRTLPRGGAQDRHVAREREIHVAERGL